MPTPEQTGADAAWMRRALALARRGEGWTRPNPPVGALVVRNGTPVGSGYHRKAGGPHAEVYALRAAGAQARGATLYVTLEPCCTQGRTPACTEAVLAAGISRVVVGTRDPNPAHRGKGLRMLRRAGLDVVCGVEEQTARELIAPFAVWMSSGRPFVTLKMAMTLDGRIADDRQLSRWITSEPARREVNDLRRRADAVMVGRGTAMADDPSLLCAGRRSSQYRVIVDSTGRLDLGARVLRDAHRAMTIVATTARCPAGQQERYRSTGADVLVLPSRGDQVSLRSLLRVLGRRGLLHVVCEGGAGMAHGLLRQGLVHECRFFVAPKVLGSSGALPVVLGKGWSLAAAPRLEFVECRLVGPDVLLRARPLKTE